MDEQAQKETDKQQGCKILTCIKRTILICVGLVMLCVVTGLLYQMVATAQDAKDFPPPGQMVDVGGHKLHINVTGQGGPTVVLDAGVCDCSLNWCLVQPEVAKFTQVCSYDRAGMGWSEPGPMPRTSQQIVTELHTLLHKAELPGPYILVGHSFGGYNVRLFASTYPDEVAGIVLVDAAHEDQWPKLPQSVVSLYDWWTQDMRKNLLLSPLGVTRKFFTWPNPKLPPALQPEDVAVHAQTSYTKTLYSEWRHIMTTSAEQLRTSAPLPDVPLIVLTAESHGETPPPGVSDGDFAAWKKVLFTMQEDLARKNNDSLHKQVENSTHVIPLDRPDAVIDAIRHVVSAVRDQRPLRS